MLNLHGHTCERIPRLEIATAQRLTEGATEARSIDGLGQQVYEDLGSARIAFGEASWTTRLMTKFGRDWLNRRAERM